MSMWRVRTTFTGPQGSPWVNTAYFSPAGTAQQAANAVGAFWGAIDAFMNSTVVWSTGTIVDELDDNTGQPIGNVTVTAVTGAGALADVLLPRQTQALVRLRTGSYANGRERRGRWFIPGITETDNTTGGAPTAALSTAVQSAINTLLADPNSELVVWSPTYASYRAVTSGSMWNQWASLRSRRD